MNSQKQADGAFDYYPRLAMVRDYVVENLSEPISLEDAAGIASLEKRYFARFFRAKTGVSFSEWLHDLRIDRAKELLEREDLSISSVANQAGFDSERTFRRAFERRVGSTPSAYRRSKNPDLTIFDVI